MQSMTFVGLGGLGVTCSPRGPSFPGSNPAEFDGFFQDVKILSTSPSGRDLSWELWVWDFWLVKEPQAWKKIGLWAIFNRHIHVLVIPKFWGAQYYGSEKVAVHWAAITTPLIQCNIMQYNTSGERYNLSRFPYWSLLIHLTIDQLSFCPSINQSINPFNNHINLQNSPSIHPKYINFSSSTYLCLYMYLCDWRSSTAFIIQSTIAISFTWSSRGRRLDQKWQVINPRWRR